MPTVCGKTIDIVGAVSMVDNHLSGHIGASEIRELVRILEITRRLMVLDFHSESESEVDERVCDERFWT